MKFSSGKVLLLAGLVILPNRRAMAYWADFSIYSFATGVYPSGSLVLQGTNLYGVTTTGAAGNGGIYTVGTNGEGFRYLHELNGSSDGGSPYGGLLLSDGILYGTAEGGGLDDGGTIFSIGTNEGTLTVLHSFSGTGDDGSFPVGALIISGTNLYGTASEGGANGQGVVYTIGTNGEGYQTLYSFNLGSSGYDPEGRLLLNGGYLYGTASAGGSGVVNPAGTVFSLTTAGDSYTVLATFSGTTDPDSVGNTPLGSLLLSSSTLFGTTSAGGPYGDYGTVFAVSTNGGSFSVIHYFGGADDPGISPGGDLVWWAEGLYIAGVTFGEGDMHDGSVYFLSTDGGDYGTLWINGTAQYGPNGILFTGAGTGTGRRMWVTATGGEGKSDGSIFGLGP
jgi:uncharacterized repeat protein (TIGR03803 family)